MFLPVLLDEHKKFEDIIYPEKLIINNNIKFISNKKYQLMFNYPIFNYFCVSKKSKRFYENIFKSKIVFVGGILNEKYV